MQGSVLHLPSKNPGKSGVSVRLDNDRMLE